MDGLANLSLREEPQSMMAAGKRLFSPQNKKLNLSNDFQNHPGTKVPKLRHFMSNLKERIYHPQKKDTFISNQNNILGELDDVNDFQGQNGRAQVSANPDKSLVTQANLITSPGVILETKMEDYSIINSVTKRGNEIDESPLTELKNMNNKIGAGESGAPEGHENSTQHSNKGNSINILSEIQSELMENKPKLTANQRFISYLPKPVQPTKADEFKEEEEKFCRICKDDENEMKLVQPCKCKGSIGYAHSMCLQKWIESKAEDSALSCEICKAPYRVINKKRVTCTQFKEFIYDPANLKLNIAFCVMALVALGLLFGTYWSLTHLGIGDDIVIKVVHYFLMSIFGLAVLSVVMFYIKKIVLDEWEFVRAPRGTQLTMQIVSKKNHWKIVVIEDQVSVLSQQSQLDQSLSQAQE